MLWQFVFFLAVHWVADFVLQTHWQASNKSKRLDALARHVSTYTVCLFFTALFIFPTTEFDFLWFTLVNGALHFCTDYVTSRWSSRMWAAQRWHDFFVVIGFDQLIHQVTLAVTLWVFLSN